jgi:hypothetical protein
VNVPTAAGGASCTLWARRWPCPRRGGADVPPPRGRAPRSSDQPDARRACLLCAAGFLFESRVGLGAGAAEITSSLSDGSESSVVGLRGPSAWLEGLFAFGAGYSASSAKTDPAIAALLEELLDGCVVQPGLPVLRGRARITALRAYLKPECALAEQWRNAICQRSRACASAASSDGRRK